MNIEIKKETNGYFITENKIDFGRGGCAMVSVDCDEHGCDEMLLRRGAESFLNRLASKQGMRVERVEEGSIATIPVGVERGESARVKFIEFPIDIFPQ